MPSQPCPRTPPCKRCVARQNRQDNIVPEIKHLNTINHFIPEGAIPRSCDSNEPHASHPQEQYRISAPYTDYWCPGVPSIDDYMQPATAEAPSESIIVKRATLLQMIGDYVGAIETERTNKYCKCEWIVHPDDTEREEGKRRIRRGDASLLCPVHTKEGFLNGFFTWLSDQND